MKQIWAKRPDDPYKLENISMEQIRSIETSLNIVFPVEYVEIIKFQNGGITHYNAYPTEKPTSWASDHVNVDFIYGIGKNEGILDSSTFIKEWNLPKDIILISGSGHYWIALDYRNKKSDPNIIYIDTELDNEFKIADNFYEFLDKLYIHDYEVPEDAIQDWTEKEAEYIFSKKNFDEAFPVIIYFQYNHSELNWWLSQLKKLAAIKDKNFNLLVAESLYITCDLHETLDHSVIKEIVNLLEIEDPDINMWVTQVKEKIGII
jgi:hypothetical protein